MAVGGDVDYERTGAGYGAQRQPDPVLAARIRQALGPVRTVLNVGAGTGSYEPENCYVLAVEPSAVMRAQRRPGAGLAIEGFAEGLPLDDDSVDAAMAVATVHQWRDLAKGLAELRRVARGPVVVAAFDGSVLSQWWLNDYAPELLAAEQQRYPPIEAIARGLGGQLSVETVPIAIDCVDGITEAFYARPERLLDPAVRRAQSSWGFVAPEVEPRFVAALSADLASGAWDARYGRWRDMPAYDGSRRLIISRP
ncbi:MAG: SAM-dependent methyltransferase [Phenylobacterium sp.]|uniref:class I SAM-dependent methyltransferase n=1 Tax=Phenylobacterium sp. TaxID=1871053 RepID=UPI0025DBA9EB|nr:class I SAM-dependent methyltransferase [Phenylobacterium sp.]MBA4011026.1 SAM-dependent methyltransferase [Phenylobacterium sp.]